MNRDYNQAEYERYKRMKRQEKQEENREHKLKRRLSKIRRIMSWRLRGKPSSETATPTITGAVLKTAFLALKVIFIGVLLLASTLFGLGLGMLKGYFSTAQEPEIVDLSQINKESKILDKDGEVVHTLSGASTLSEFVSFDKLSYGYIDDAFIAIEDERFDTHPGIDFKRISSAVAGLLMSQGQSTHGGSTITQQTVKLITGKDDISAQRKIQEWYNAVRLEKERDKDSIMELYLNLVPMSNNIVGVQAASKAYFNKNAQDLTLAEAAFLAGIPNQPAIYNPLTEYGRRNSLRRSRFILQKMLEIGRIDQDEYEQALNAELNFDFSFLEKDDEVVQSYFIDYVIEEVQNDLVTQLGYSPELAAMTVYNYGLTIETTLDQELQAHLEENFNKKELFIKNPAVLPDSPEKPQASITVIDNAPGSRGCVRGMVGGYGKKKRNFILNRAVHAKRQPGSSIKPLVVYGPALETGKISMATPLNDRQMFLDPDDPTRPYPQNYYRDYWGAQTLESALVNSINTIAADIYVNYITPQIGLSFLKQCGIDRTDEPYVSTALGGFSEGMSSYEMAGAYSVFANEGQYNAPRVYLRVLDNNGNVLLDRSEETGSQVYKPETCSVMTYLLQSVAKASHNDAVCSSTPTAGKTGTTEYYSDIWFCGYTPYYTAAVWYGYDNANGRRTYIPLEDGKNAVDIWRHCMQDIHKNLPRKEFVMAPGVQTLDICVETGALAGPFCSKTARQYFIPGSPANPSSQCPLHTGSEEFDAEGQRRRPGRFDDFVIPGDYSDDRRRDPRNRYPNRPDLPNPDFTPGNRRPEGGGYQESPPAGP